MRPAHRLLAFAAGAAVCSSAHATPDGGFHLEPKAAIDDVFSDSSDYRRIVDKFLGLAEVMQQTRDDFARSVQATLAELRPSVDGKTQHKCPEAQVAMPYARALSHGQDYLRAGRELTRYYEQVKEYDRLGETLGLTPDYRWKVKRVITQWAALLTDYREMKVAFHDQLTDELRFAGCDLQRLASRVGSLQLKDESWPAPDQPGAPGVPLAPPPDKGPLPAPPATQAAARPSKGEPIDVAPALPGSDARGESLRHAGILFYVDNTRCHTASHVTLDGHPLGDAPPQTRVAFPTAPGPHDLCLLPEASKKKCGDTGTIRKSYLHEGWTIALRCE